MIVRCKTQNCGATGEGDSLQEAIAQVDHSIALHKGGACPGGNVVNYELVKKRKDGTLEYVKDLTKPVCSTCGSELPHGTKLDTSSKTAKETKTIPKDSKSDKKDQPTDQPAE